MNELNRDLGSGPSPSLLNPTWSAHLMHSKANLLIPGGGEGKYWVYCRMPSAENRQLMLERLKLPDGFQSKVFKGKDRGEDCKIGDQLMDFVQIG